MIRHDAVPAWFFFVGPEKTGTSWIHECLKQQADIRLPKGVKETFFFDRYHAKGIDWYLSHFDEASRATIPVSCHAEVAPSYFSNQQAAGRIARHFESAEIICTLRDPVARTVSLYRHLRRYGWTRQPFEQAVESFPFLVTGSEYFARLANWWDLFGTGHVHLLFFDEIADNPRAFIERLENILRVSGLRPPADAGAAINRAEKSRSYLLAKFARAAATWLRSNQAYSVIESLRKLGLKELIYSGGQSSDEQDVTPENIAWLRARLAADMRALEQKIGALPVNWSVSREIVAS